MRLLPRDGIDVAALMVVAKHHGVRLDACGRGQTVVACHTTGINVDALRLHLGGVQPLGIRVIQELLLAADPVNALAIALPNVIGVIIGGLLKVARACRPRLGSCKLALCFGYAIRVIIILDPVAGILALGPLVLLVQHAGRVEGRVLNDCVIVGAAASGIAGYVIIRASGSAIAHGLRPAEGRARDIGHHSKLAHCADVAITAAERKTIRTDAGHRVQARIASPHGLAL